MSILGYELNQRNPSEYLQTLYDIVGFYYYFVYFVQVQSVMRREEKKFGRNLLQEMNYIVGKYYYYVEIKQVKMK